MGWTIEALSEDYGEDFLVRMFDKGKTTPLSMYVQSKATDNIATYTSSDQSNIHYPIETMHLVHWERFWEPVVLAVYDARSKRTYWRVVQPWLEQLTTAKRGRLRSAKTARVSIPIENCLNKSGLRRLISYTEHRFNRFQREQEGANHLVECLKEAVGLEVSYDAQAGILLIPNGSFHQGNGGAKCYLFGKTAALLGELARLSGKPEQQTLVDAIHHAADALRSMSKRDLAKQKNEWSPVDDA